MAFKRPVVPLIPVLPRASLAKRLWRVYNQNLVHKPVVTRAWSSVVGLTVGDALGQLAGGEPFDLGRTLRTGLFAFFVHGPVCYHFYKWVDKAVFPTSPKSVQALVAKVLLDQAVFNPPFLCTYFAAMKCLEGKPHHVIPTLNEKLVPSLTAGLGFWVPAHLVNFSCVPDSCRTLVILGMGVAWNAILSTISSNAQKEVQLVTASQNHTVVFENANVLDGHSAIYSTTVVNATVSTELGTIGNINSVSDIEEMNEIADVQVIKHQVPDCDSAIELAMHGAKCHHAVAHA